MSEHITAWQCAGCGRIEVPQNCRGICKDQHVGLVPAEDYEQLMKELTMARAQTAALATCMRQIINTRPRNEEWKSCFRAAQEHLLQGLELVGR